MSRSTDYIYIREAGHNYRFQDNDEDLGNPGEFGYTIYWENLGTGDKGQYVLYSLDRWAGYFLANHWNRQNGWKYWVG